MSSTAKSLLVLVLGFLAAEVGALAFETRWWVLAALLFWFGPIGLLGAAVVGNELSRLAGDEHGRISGMESWRARIAWMLGLGLLLATHAAPLRARTFFSEHLSGWPRATVAVALAFALVPWALVPIALIDERVRLRAAVGTSLSLVLRARPSELLLGPVLFATSTVAADFTVQILFGADPWREFRRLSHEFLFTPTLVAILVLTIALARWSLSHTAALARTSIRLGGELSVSGIICIALPLALAIMVRAALMAASDGSWWVELHPALLLHAPAVLAALLFLYVAIESFRFRARERGATRVAPTLVLLDAADVEQNGPHTLREGATLTIAASGATVPAPTGMRVCGFPPDTAEDALLDAWVDEPLPASGAAYRSAPSAFGRHATVVIGSPSAARADRLAAHYARVALPFAIGSALFVLSTAIAFCMSPDLLRDLVARWS